MATADSAVAASSGVESIGKKKVGNWRSLKDMTGLQVYEWTVLSRAPQRWSRQRVRPAVWNCRCSCGREYEVCGSDLRNGTSRRCRVCAALARQTDLTGRVFGRITVLRRSERPRYWVCRCACAAKTEWSVRAASLVAGVTVSCSCLRYAGKATRLGLTSLLSNSTGLAWWNMMQQCYYPHDARYVLCGGKGIQVGGDWNDQQQGFLKFKEDMGECPAGMTILRKDARADYSKENCLWGLPTEVLISRKGVTRHGRTQSVFRWAKEHHIPSPVLRFRLRVGWDLEAALKTPVPAKEEQILTYQGESHTLREWSEYLDVSCRTLSARINRKKPIWEVLKKDGD